MHEISRLQSSHDYFVFEPKVPKEGGEKLVINRHTGAISQQADVGSSAYNPSAKVDDVYGIFGVVRLLAGPYLVVITGRRAVGKIEGKEIWKVTNTKLIPFHAESKLSAWQLEDELRYRKMIESVLAIDGFYFSYHYDLTHTLQRIHELPSDQRSTPLWTRVDSRFWWNRSLVQDLVAQKLHAWILPVMMGFCEIRTCEINNKSFEFILIGRRNVKRVGTRYFVRGVDKEGNVANAVETEQIIFHNNAATSLVQVRGSIPVFWRQTPSLKYKPKLLIYGGEIETPPAFRRHFEELKKFYNRVVAINLIDQKGSELQLGNAYEKEAKKYPDLKYVAFDFHHQCRNMRWDRLSILMDQINDDVQKNGFFFAEHGKIQKVQEGIFRTNCIDNLDRTNVVQGLIAKRSLADQFLQLGIFTNPNDKVENYPTFEHVLKNVWADHADVVSLQYSGTGALKTDFTRTGKRTVQGALNDGVNSVMRYYYNNFTDGFRQDAFDLFVGNYMPAPSEATPFKQTTDLVKIVLIAFAVFILALLLPHEYKTYFTVLFFIFVVVGARLALQFGKKFVNKPALYLKEHNN